MSIDFQNAEKSPEDVYTKDAVIETSVDDVVVGTKHTVRGLKPRHAQMMAIAGAIGTGLFVGTGSALKRAGPLGLLLGYVLYSGLIWTSYNAMCEMVTWLPVDGSFLHLAGRFVGPSFGFGMAWLYTYNNAVIVAAEATAVAGFVNYWNDSISNGVWCALFIVSCFLLNVFGVRIYGEGEFWLSSFKVFLVVCLMVFTVVTMCGGNPLHDAFGFRYWKNPGVFGDYLVKGPAGHFAGLFSIFVQAAFAFGGPDMIAIAAGEIQYPRRVIPSVTKRVIYRLIFFFVGGALCVGILVPHNDPILGTSQKGGGSSPFVIAATRLQIPVLPDIINATLLTSAWSVGLDCCYCATRSLYSLSLSGHAPKIFQRTWRGVPTASVIVICLVGCLSFMSLSNDSVVVFNWITNITGSGILLVIALLHFMYIRWHAALKAQGVDRSQLPFHKRGQIYLSWFACIAYVILLLTNGFYIFVPGHWDTPDFLFAYLAIPAFVVPFLGHKIYRACKGHTRLGLIPAHEIDLFSGKAEIDEEEKTYPELAEGKGAKFERWLWG